ncbi:class I SAM-dependent methyltransferase [Patescibacteria group bacterium]|nr:class I SAM-dependent methyltransferase [Patescibacteria group bacterium]
MKEYIRQTTEVYERLGKEYLASVANGTPPVIKLFMSQLRPSGKVLDVGCADGRDSRILSQHGFQITGIDLCEMFLEEARRLVPNAIFEKKDVLELGDWPESIFDGIWANAVLLHLEKQDTPEALRSFYRLLQQGGRLFIGVKRGFGEKSIREKLSGNQSRFFSFYTKKEIEHLARQAGFSLVYSTIGHDTIGRGEVRWVRLIAEKR